MTKENAPAAPDAGIREGETPQEGLRREKTDPSGVRLFASRFFSDYGMLAVLLLLIVFFSLVTIEKRRPVGAEAAESVAGRIARGFGQACAYSLWGARVRRIWPSQHNSKTC